MADKKEPKKRTQTGQFKKGVSGNPTGRPKMHKLTQKDRNEIKAILKEKDISKVLEFLCERAQGIDDVFRFVKEFAPYLAPKLQSTTNINKTDNRIQITWKSEIDKLVKNVDEEYERLTSQTDAGVIDVEVLDKEKEEI